MTEISYDVAKLSVRDDLIAAHRHSWAHLARPGTWWSGARRLAIAAEVRNAPGCELCLRRKDALSPHAVEGSHDHSGDLPDNLVEVIHGVRNDAGRLTERWYDRVLADGLTDAEYVETVAIIATIVVAVMSSVIWFGTTVAAVLSSFSFSPSCATSSAWISARCA